MTDEARIIEIEADISDARQWIRNMGKTGAEYEIENAKSRRKFKGFSMSDILKTYIPALQAELRDLNCTSGIQAGY